MKKILAIAPHPDDETLGCAGTLLGHLARGDEVHWLIATEISVNHGFTAARVHARALEVQVVARAYGFGAVHSLGFATTQLDQVPSRDLIAAIGHVVGSVVPDTLYLPYRHDAHSDHQAVFDAASACTKSFRFPSVKSVYVYETLSETGFGLKPEDTGFRPNLFVDIADHLERKIEIMGMYEGEMAAFPFPRSDVCIRALAQLRGSQCGVHAAEAFMILKEVR